MQNGRANTGVQTTIDKRIFTNAISIFLSRKAENRKLSAIQMQILQHKIELTKPEVFFVTIFN